jgi:hypothetical protein
MRILVSLHGTTIIHPTGAGRTREERVQQVRRREPSVRQYAAYIPIGNAVAKVQTWASQGADIVYLSSHRRDEHVAQDRLVLVRYGFPPGDVVSRRASQTYADVAECVAPDVLVEDDCESIGGEAEMVYPRLRDELKARSTSIVVPEFGGIDHLPDDLTLLRH